MFYKNLGVYDKKMKFKEYKALSFDEKIDLDDESNDKLGTCMESYNFSGKSGVLKDSFGINNFVARYNYIIGDTEKREVVLPSLTAIRRIFYFRLYALPLKEYISIFVLITSRGEFKYIDLGNTTSYDMITIDKIDLMDYSDVMYTVINGFDSLVVCERSTNEMFLWTPFDEEGKVKNPSLFFTSMCWHDNRSFATTDNYCNSILFSEEYNPLNFSTNNKQGGFINLNDDLGACKLAILFKDNVYVFREFGITKVVRGNGKLDYEGETVYVCRGKIFNRTICNCGNKIIFFASDGLFEFDGSKVKKIKLGYEKYFRKEFQKRPIAKYMKGVYYLSCKMNFNDDQKLGVENFAGYTNNAFVKYYVEDDAVVVSRSVEVVDMVTFSDKFNDELVVLYYTRDEGNKLGILVEEGQAKDIAVKRKWVSKLYDFDKPEDYKFIKEFKFVTKADIELCLYFDNSIKKIKVKGKSTMQTIKINQKTKLFGFGFETENCNNYITNPRITVGFYDAE